MKVTIYMSGPMEIHWDNQEVGRNWRIETSQKIMNWLMHTIGGRQITFEVIDPYQVNDYVRDAGGELIHDLMVNADKKHILRSDFMILNSNYSGVGTPMECLFAWERHIPVISFGKHTNPWYTQHVMKNFKNLDDLLFWLSHSNNLIELMSCNKNNIEPIRTLGRTCTDNL